MTNTGTMTRQREVYTEPLTTEQEMNRLTAQDRCDACGSQAYFIAEKDGSKLLFCNHHFRKHEVPLEDRGFLITDQSYILTRDTKPGGSKD